MSENQTKSEGRQMTDREMLMLVYGAMKAADGADNANLTDVIKMLEKFLWPEEGQKP